MGQNIGFLPIWLQLVLFVFIISIIFLSTLLITQNISRLQFWTWTNYYTIFKISIIYLSIFILYITLLIVYEFCFNLKYMDTISFKPFNLVGLTIDKLSLNFVTLICFFFPAIFILADYDFSIYQYRFFLLLVLLQFNIYLFIFANNILVFYLLYELMIGLVFFIMHATSNSRGSIEAILFFFGWAIIGSILVGLAVIYIVLTTQTSDFKVIRNFTFTPDEIYLIHWLIFFGFGTKLAIWPFWYWLPRAHVEVSTAMSIFLSCVLIKVCLYGFMRFLYILQDNIVVFPFIFCCILCVFDIAVRLITQMDLKAVVAYGSVLHINLLLILILLDGTKLSLGLILYIWGHSYATAGLFFAVNLIERHFSSRSTFEISGVYSTNPAVGLILLFTVITFLEFPLTFFFWGEFWLWTLLLSVISATTIVLMFITTVVYAIVFFRIWWGILFGAGSPLAKTPKLLLTHFDLYLASYLIITQYIWGLQPNLFSIFCMS